MRTRGVRGLGAVRVGGRTGLWLMMTAATLPVGLSLVGTTRAGVVATSVAALPFVLAGALAWMGRRPAEPLGPFLRGRRRQKRAVLMLTLLALVLTPVTEWPLRLSFAASAPAVARLNAHVESKFRQDLYLLSNSHVCGIVYNAVLLEQHAVPVNRQIGFLPVEKAERIPDFGYGPGLRLYLKGGRVLYRRPVSEGATWNLDARP